MKGNGDKRGEYELLFGNGFLIPLGQITEEEALKIVLDKKRKDPATSLWRATPGTRHLDPITIPNNIIEPT